MKNENETRKRLVVTRGSNESVMRSPYALKMSAQVMMAVLHTALLGFFRAFTIREIALSLVYNIL